MSVIAIFQQQPFRTMPLGLLPLLLIDRANNRRTLNIESA